MMCVPSHPLHDRERGQTLVVFTGAIVLLLLIGALVVDLGFVFLVRRHQQDAADPGALAAARYIAPAPADATRVGQMWTAACFYAVENGLKPTRTSDNGACDPGGATDGSTITVHYPPSQSAGAPYAGNPSYVEVAISQRNTSLFAGVAGIPGFTVTTAAVAAFDTGTAGSSSLIALNPTLCQSGKVNGGAGGSGGIYIHQATGVTGPGGYIQVNSNCGAMPTPDDACTNGNSGAFFVNGSGYVTAPALYVQGDCVTKGGPTVTIGTIDEGAAYVGDPYALLRPPSPGDLPAQGCPSGGTSDATNPKTCKLSGNQNLQPGTYYGGWNIGSPGTSITLEPGIYIMAGGGITQTGGTLTSASGRVMIFSTDASPAFRSACLAGGGSAAGCQGDINLAGQGTLNLTGLDRNTGCLPYGTSTCPYGGMLVWQDAHGSGPATGKADVNLGGGVSFYISGTIYSAGGDVDILGNGISSGCTSGTNCAAVQIVADTFQVGGAAVLDMPYDPNNFVNIPMKGLVK